MLKWICNLTDGTGKLARWRISLSEVEFHVVHRAGIANKDADALTQLETGGMSTTKLDVDFSEMLVSKSTTEER